MKITFSFWESENSNHTSTWDIAWCDPWLFRNFIDNQLELQRARQELYELKKKLAAPTPTENPK